MATPPMFPSAPWTPGQRRPLSDEALKAWQTRVDRARQRRKTFEPQWERALARYAKAKTEAPKADDDINALLDYRHVEQKKATLFHRTPEINLLPVDPQDPMVPYDQILPLREKVLNYELGPDRSNAKRALHATLIDAIAASGWMAVKVGYEQVSLPTQVMQPGILGQPPTPMEVLVPIWSRRFVTEVSSKSLLVPHDFHSTRFDESPWLAVEGVMPLAHAERLGWSLDAELSGQRAAPSVYHEQGEEAKEPTDPHLKYVEIWYKAALFDPEVFHPELYRCLVLIDGSDVPAKHADSPYQSLTPQGQLTDDSMVGSPIHVDTLRDLIDSAYVPSDLVVGEQLSMELNKFRTGLMRNRRARRPKELIADTAGAALIEKVARNEGPVPVPVEYIGEGGQQRLMAVVEAGTEPRDNYTAQQIIEHDWELAMGASANQQGQFSKTKRTATEVRTVQGNSAARAKTDEERVREYVIRLVRKFDAIVHQTMREAEVVKVLGPQGSQLWSQWRALPGRYGYHIQPDSGRYLDAEEYRTQKLNEYNLLRKDPLINAAELTRVLVRALGYDPGKLVPRDAAPEKPEPPKMNIAFNAEQAFANSAEMRLILSLLEQSGYQIPPELVQQLMAVAQLRQAVTAMTPQQPEHQGPSPRTEPINKRSSERTSGLPGVGRVS